MLRDRLWFKYKRRQSVMICPLCHKEIRWVYDGIYYYPCDAEPVLFKRSESGKLAILKKRELIESCAVYKSGESPEGFEYGLIPHVYTCPELQHQI